MPKRAEFDVAESARLYQSGQTILQLAVTFKVSSSTIWQRLRDYGVKIRTPSEAPRVASFNVEQALQMYASGKSVNEIACAMDREPITMLRHLARATQGAGAMALEAQRLKQEVSQTQAKKVAARRLQRIQELASKVTVAEKHCSACKTIQPADSFHHSLVSADGLARSCKPCVNKKALEWRIRTGFRQTEPPERGTNRRLLSYGLTRQAFQALFVLQGGACAVCRVALQGIEIDSKQPKATKRLCSHIDHDHETGQVRGLLCIFCNHLLGNARDDPTCLEAAIAYLESPPALQVPN